MIYGEKIVRFDQALTLWEDLCFALRMDYIYVKAQSRPEPYPLTGPLLNADQFRSYLLNSHNEDFDDERFCGPNEIGKVLGFTYALPANLYAWTKISRRVFHLTSEMQTMLEATSLDGIDWDDIMWPVNSLAVTIDKPLLSDDGENQFDCFLMTNYPANQAKDRNQMILFHAFGTDLDHYEPLRKDDRPLLKKAAERKKTEGGAYRRMKQWFEKQHRLVKGFDALILPKKNESINDFLANKELWDANKHMIDPAAMAFRLIFGICLLHKTKGAAKYVTSQERPKPRNLREKRLSITSEADLFLVSYEKFMTPGEREIVKKIGDTHNLKRIRYHFRDGYWRRPRGRGNDPLYPKTEWVRPTEVNIDLKPLEGVTPSVRKVL